MGDETSTSKSKGSIKKVDIRKKLSDQYYDQEQAIYEKDRAERARKHPELVPRPKADVRKAVNWWKSKREKTGKGFKGLDPNNSEQLILDSELDMLHNGGVHPLAPRKKMPPLPAPKIDKVEPSKVVKTPVTHGWLKDSIKAADGAIAGLDRPNKGRDDAQRAESQATKMNAAYESMQPKPRVLRRDTKPQAKQEESTTKSDKEKKYSWKTWKWRD